jgi:aminoglycoside phosphotransferase (APT) family kinase protein
MADLLDHPTNVRPEEELDLSKLEPFLRGHFPDELGPLTLQQFPSGHSNLTYLLRLGNKELVLRRPPFGSNVKSAHDMSREFRVLSKLHSVYAPAPKVLFYSDDLSILGVPFYLMEPIHGVIIRREPPPGLDFSPEKARRLSESFIENLALLHNLDYAGASLADLGKPQGYLERQVRGWIERYHASKTHDHPEVEMICLWMRQHLPSAGGASLIHNDYKYDNVVLDPANITKIIGVLDWEMCTIGDPLSDLGTTLAYWVDPQDPDELQRIRWCPSTQAGSLTRAQLVDRYARATGRGVSDVVFYLAFARFKVAVIVQQIYFRYHLGVTKDARFASMPEVVKALLRASLHSAKSGSI